MVAIAKIFYLLFIAAFSSKDGPLVRRQLPQFRGWPQSCYEKTALWPLLISYLAEAGASLTEAIISPEGASSVRLLIKEIKHRAKATPAISKGRWKK